MYLIDIFETNLAFDFHKLVVQLGCTGARD